MDAVTAATEVVAPVADAVTAATEVVVPVVDGDCRYRGGGPVGTR